MTKIKTSHIACPQCGKTDTWQSNNLFRPFCSKRCKLIDLGDWASEKHRVPGETINPDQDDKDDTP